MQNSVTKRLEMKHYHPFLLSNPLSLTTCNSGPHRVIPGWDVSTCRLPPTGHNFAASLVSTGYCLHSWQHTRGPQMVKSKTKGVGRKDSERVIQGVSKGFWAVSICAVSIFMPAPGHYSFQALRNIPPPPHSPHTPSPLCCGPVQKASHSLGLHRKLALTLENTPN